ncbi:MAG: phosphoribosyltransferase family protein [Nitrospirota bacterium]
MIKYAQKFHPSSQSVQAYYAGRYTQHLSGANREYTMHLNPKRMSGSWDDGYTLDLHICSSEFVGYNEYGHPQFESTRTELGEMLYRLKYKGDQSVIVPIAQAACDFVRKWNLDIDVIVPTPPSKTRSVQPLFQIADELGKLLSRPVDKTSVQKSKATPELKNVDYAKRLALVGGAHSIQGDALQGRRILLLDDLYQTGATLNAIARLLKEAGGATAVFALALTRARS